MRKLMKGEQAAALPSSIRRIRYLVFILAACFLVLATLGWLLLLQYRVHEALDRQEILFRARAERVQGNLHVAQNMTLRAQGVLVRLFDVGVEKQLAQVNTSEWVARLQRRGDRQYIALPVSASRENIPKDAAITALADMLSFTLRVNNVQYHDVQNAYLLDLRADRFFVIPRRLTPAREVLGKNPAYPALVSATNARLRNQALLEKLYAAPDQALLLEPGRDWVSQVPVVTLATLVQIHGEPAAILALDFPLSTLLANTGPEQQFYLQTAAGVLLPSPEQALHPLGPAVFKSLAERRLAAAETSVSFIQQGLFPNSAILGTEFDAWGWRAVEVVEMRTLWERFRENTLWLLGLTGLSCSLMFACVKLVDRRVMRPAQRQSLQLQESETLGRMVIQSAGVCLMIVDCTQAVVLLENDAARQMRERVQPGEFTRLHEACLKTITQGTVGDAHPRQEKFTFEVTQSDEEVFYLEVRLVEVIYRGKPAMLCSMSDVTASKQSETRLLAAIRAADSANLAKSSFLAMMSHEIRTPLNGLLGCIELLSLTALEPRQRDQLSVMQQASQSLIQILNDVLDFSKIEANQMLLAPRPCQMDRIVEEIARRFAPAAEGKSLQLVCVIDPTLHEPVLLDPLKMEQVLSNLVSNAVKFTDQGKVVIEVSRMSGAGQTWLRMRVIDTGIGIAQEVQQRLFAPFVQAEQSDSRRFGGTGLGLAICRRLVELMAGEIRLVSEPGLGSCFDVRVPIQQAEISSDEIDRIPALDGLVVGLCISLRELYQGVEQVLGHYGAKAVRFNPEQPPATPVDVLVCDQAETGRCPDADVVIENTPLQQPDMNQTPIRASRYAWSGLMRAILAAAGVEHVTPVASVGNSGGQAVKGLHLLLVEDHPINQITMRQQLEWLGQRVDLASDGPDALALAERYRYDLILTDLQMPSMDGYELARALRSRGVIVPIVAITASVGEDLGLTCEAAGIDQCLTKPVLLSTLKELLGAISKDSITPMPSWGPAGPLVGLYLRNDLLALSAAMQRHDAVGFGRGLHAMAGALATLEHAAEWQACRWLEKAVQQRGLDGIHAEWLALQASIQQLIADYGDLVASESAWCGQGESCT